MNNDWIKKELRDIAALIRPSGNEGNRTEAEIEGKRLYYDGCRHDTTLEQAKAEYEPLGFEYIGSGNVTYINGVRNEYNSTIHFFKRIAPDYSPSDKAEFDRRVEYYLNGGQMVSGDEMRTIIQHRSAFSLYLRKGMEEVKKRYPESVAFVEQHKGKSLLEVTAILTEELNKLNK